MDEVPAQPTGHEPLVEVYDRRLGYTVWAEVTPTHCTRGHRYKPGVMSTHWVGCGCGNARSGGHTMYACNLPTDDGPCPDRRMLPACDDPDRQNESHRRAG